MVTELTNYVGRYVYNPKGQYVGQVSNVVIDLPSRSVHGLLLTRTNPGLIDGARDVAVPYRWVSSMGDIVLLARFPDHVTVTEEVESEEEIVAA